MQILITNLSETAAGMVAISILRPDMPPGEPSSLEREHTLRPGESASFTLPPMATIVASDPAAQLAPAGRPGWFEPPSQEVWP
jgi:hypothetical protein